MQGNETKRQRYVRILRNGWGLGALSVGIAACAAGAGPGSAALPTPEGLLAIDAIVKSLDAAAQEKARANPQVAVAAKALDAAWLAYSTAASAGQPANLADVDAAAAALSVLLVGSGPPP